MITFTITNKNRPKATVVMLVSLYGKQYKKSIGVGVPVKYWNAIKKRAKVTADFNGNPVNDEIDRWEEIDEDIHLSSFYDTEEPAANNVIGEVFRRFPQLNVSETARTIGIHKSLLSKYIYGTKKPSEKRTAEILDTLRQIGRELAQIHG